MISKAKFLYTPPPPKNYCDEEVVFVGSFFPGWGHEITDGLKHLWFYFEEKYAHLKNLKFVYVLLLDDPPMHKEFFTLLKLIGFPAEKLQLLTQPTRFKRVYVPDDCFFADLEMKHNGVPLRRCTIEYANLLKRVPDFPAPPNLDIQKVYFTRAQIYIWKDYNEIEIENFFKNQGFTIICPEKIDFLTELAILQNCEVFATTDGSISLNLLFCRKAKQMLMLLKTRHFTPYGFCAYELVDPAVEIILIESSFSLIANLRKRPNWWLGPFFLYETNTLRRYFGLSPKAFPLRKFMAYLHWHYCRWLTWAYLDHKFLAWSRPLRDKLQLGRRIKKLFKKS